MDTELGEDVLDVVADRRLGEEESFRDPGTIEALRQELKDFTLPWRKDIEPVVTLIGTWTPTIESFHDHPFELGRKGYLPDEVNKPALISKLDRRNDR